MNGDAVEQLAEELLYRRRFDHGSMDMLLNMMVATRPQPHRGVWTDTKQNSLSLIFGFYVHGPISGITKATYDYPKVCRYVNACVSSDDPDLGLSECYLQHEGHHAHGCPQPLRLRQLHLHLWTVQEWSPVDGTSRGRP